MNPLEQARDSVKSAMHLLARQLDRITGGRLTPNQVTFMGLAAHIPVALLIGSRHYLWAAAIFLAIFGLFDTLDGELARHQKRATLQGMFIDSSTDRIKEVILYCGIMTALVRTGHDLTLVVAVGALGASLCTSYLNAWGEAVLSQGSPTSSHKINKSFRGGVLSFDLRMFLIIVGLFINQLEVVIYIIFVLAAVTVIQRFVHISGRLKHV
jgi:phosphatidylglycerophosphate synthase